MDSPSSCTFDDGILDSLEWSDKSDTLSSFLDRLSSSMPHVVRVLEGFRGDACARTIDSGQILILHSVHKETKILAKDIHKTELFIPKNFQVKVEMIPRNSVEESTSVKDLLQTFPRYFRVLNDIPSHEITTDSMFKIIRQKGSGYFECLQIVNNEEEREVRLPLCLKGRFQALQDSREFFLDEVYAEEKDNIIHGVPVNVHFVRSSSRISNLPGLNVQSLYELGTVRLIGEFETETVFASVISEDGKTLAVFPRNLEITVQPAKTNQHYEMLRETIKKTQHKTLKRIERLNKLSLYQAGNPVRQFSQIELGPPVSPSGKPRTRSVMGTPSKTTIEKKRSNSTPPLPPKKPTRAETRNPTTNFKKPLKQALSVPTTKLTCFPEQNTKITEQGIAKGSDRPSPGPIKKPRPNYKPPEVPQDKTEPPLPPKEKSKPFVEDKEQSGTSDQDLQPIPREIDQQGQQSPKISPPIAPPRPRRRQKSLGKRSDLRKPMASKSCNERIDDSVGSVQGIEKENMDGSWAEQDMLENKEGTLEEIFGTVRMGGELSGIEDGNKTTRADSIDHDCENPDGLVCTTSTKEATGETVPPSDVNEERPRTNSIDNENTKGLKLDQSAKGTYVERALPNDENEQRPRVDSVDYENTMELKLVHPANRTSVERALSNDGNEQRPRVDSVDYENTKGLKLVHPAKGTSVETALSNDGNEQRPRVDSVDYENTKGLKLVHPANRTSVETALSNDGNEQRPRVDSVDYENTKGLKLVHPANRTSVVETALSNDGNEQRPRVDSADYENTKGLKLKIPSKTKESQENQNVVSVKDGKTESPCKGTIGIDLSIEKACDNVGDKSTLSTQANSLENTCHSVFRQEGMNKTKTETFIKDKIHRHCIIVSSDSEPPNKVDSTMTDPSKTQAENTSIEIYYTTMAHNVADNDTYYTTMENMSSDDVYVDMDTNDDTTYTSMDGSNVDSPIYENDTKEYDSDDMNYEPVDLTRTVREKKPPSNKKMAEVKNRSAPYEEVDIIQQIDSLTNRDTSAEEKDLCYERMDIPEVTELIAPSRSRSGSDNSYEEIDVHLKPGSNIILRNRSGSDNSYESVDFPINNAQDNIRKTLSNDISTPPTPPQRRQRNRKSNLGEVKGVDYKQDKPKILSSSPTSHSISSTEFEDLDSLRVHLAMKESERQVLFEQALSFKEQQQTPTSSKDNCKESQETSQQECSKDMSKPMDEVAGKYVKARPPAPPPRKPANYLDVESASGNSKSKPPQKRTPTNYSEIIGKASHKHSSKEDDMEYVDDIELFYFQKHHMEKEKMKVRAAQSENKNDHDYFDIGLHVIKEPVAIKQDPPDSNEQIPQKETPQDSEPIITKDGLQDSRGLITTKKSPNKPIIKNHSSRDPKEPMTLKHSSHDPMTSNHSSHDPNQPIATKHLLHDPKEPKTLKQPSHDPNQPIATKHSSLDQKEPMTSKHPSHDPNQPIATKHFSHDPMTSKQHSSHDPNEPMTSKQPSHDSMTPKQLASAKPIKTTKRAPLPPPKPKRLFSNDDSTESKHTNKKTDPETTVSTHSSSVSSKTTVSSKDISSSSDGKSIQNSCDKQPRSVLSHEGKVSPQRTKPPKPLPRRKPQT